MSTVHGNLLCCLYVIINIIILFSCDDCWKITVSLLSIGGCLRCIIVQTSTTARPIQSTRIHNTNNRNNRRRLTITIDQNPDFSRLYTKQTVVSPLHKNTHS